MDLATLEHQLKCWHEKKYGKGNLNAPKTMRKLGEEFGEFMEAVMYGSPSCIAEEAADVLFVMTHVVRYYCGPGALDDAVAAKLLVIHNRLLEGPENLQ